MSGEGVWVALLSGGKDSSWALHCAMSRGRAVTHALAARPADDSFLFHVPAIELTALIAESTGLRHRTFDIDSPTDTDASAGGDAELSTLEAALERVRRELSEPLAGIVTGTVESQFQHDRLDHLCTSMGIEHCSPLWGADPTATLHEMVDAGLDIRVVAVAAAGLDRSWLGRRIDEDAIDELCTLRDEYGVHVLGEGGEYETVVVDGPHMQWPIEFEAAVHWDGTRGHLEVTDAWLDRA